MSAKPDDAPAASLFERLVGGQRRPWVLVGASLFLILAPIGAAYLDGVLGQLFSGDSWRTALLPSAVIIYILAVAPILDRMGVRAVEAFRPLVLIDDDDFDRLVDQASRLNPVGELVAFGVGAAFGLWVGFIGLSDEGLFWLGPCLMLTGSLMFGLLAWTIYSAVAGTRLTAELHRQPLRVDILDPTPFEPIGRQSLSIALVFVGGMLLSVLFGLGLVNVFAWPNWLLYILLAMAPVLVFFLNMRDTHRVLAAEKKQQLEAVQQNIVLASRALMDRIAAGESTGTLAAEINALALYEERLQAARTWPYDTAMLRTLFFSLIIPAAAEIVKLVSRRLF